MTKIKICGITNIADALAATQAGVDFLGFIFYEPSPRYVAPETVAEIVSAIKGYAGERPDLVLPQFVGVFVDAPQPMVAQTLADCRLDRAQLHGAEPPEVVAAFQGRAFKAMRPQSEAEAEAMLERYAPPATHPPALLLEAYHPTLYGGTGRVTDWTLAAAIARRFPLMLAGSLTAGNVAAAITAAQPWAVDVSSGVEAMKGRKDHAKIEAFVAAVRGVKRET